MNREGNSASQLIRIIDIMRDGTERTVQRIESEVWRRYGERLRSGTAARRLAEAARMGYRTVTRCEELSGKAVLWYRLEPIGSV